MRSESPRPGIEASSPGLQRGCFTTEPPGSPVSSSCRSETLRRWFGGRENMPCPGHSGEVGGWGGQRPRTRLGTTVTPGVPLRGRAGEPRFWAEALVGENPWGTGGSSTCDLHALWSILRAWFPGLRAPQHSVLSHLTPSPSSTSTIAGRRPCPRAEHQTQWAKAAPHLSNCLRQPSGSLNSGAPLGTEDWAGLVPPGAWRCGCRRPTRGGSPRHHPREATEPTLTPPGRKRVT